MFGKKEIPRLIAHRGFTLLAPENSLISFKEAAKRGYWAIETDVRMTKDGKLVCCHDASLERTYQISALVEELTYEEIKKFHIRMGNKVESYEKEELRMPLFDEYLEICNTYGSVPFIEVKGNQVEQILYAVEKLELTKHAILSSFDIQDIIVAREKSCIFVHHIWSDYEKMLRIAEIGNGGVSYNYPNLDEIPDNLISDTHKAGTRVCLRAGDSIEAVRRMQFMGLDYIPTNCVEPVHVSRAYC